MMPLTRLSRDSPCLIWYRARHVSEQMRRVGCAYKRHDEHGRKMRECPGEFAAQPGPGGLARRDARPRAYKRACLLTFTIYLLAMASDTNAERDTQLLSVGQQCSESSCLLVDFLPFKCQHCSKSFCGEHFLVAAHRCPQYDESKHNRVAPSCESLYWQRSHLLTYAPRPVMQYPSCYTPWGGSQHPHGTSYQCRM